MVPGRRTPEGGALAVGRGVLHVPDERGDSVLHVLLAEREPLEVDRRQRVRERERAVRVAWVELGARGGLEDLCEVVVEELVESRGEEAVGADLMGEADHGLRKWQGDSSRGMRGEREARIDKEREKGRDGVRISVLPSFDLVLAQRSRVDPSRNGGWPRCEGVRQGLPTSRLLDEVFAREIEDAGGGYEVTVVAAAEITGCMESVLISIV